MRRVLHISDLHFGRADLQVVEALRRSSQELEPHVIAVSGDLTQRAKHAEFVAAAKFLNSLRAPKVVVPGNHDIPLYNVVARFLAPLARYRRYIDSDVESSFVDNEIAVAGLSTARSLTFKGGRINHEQVKRVRELFCGTENERVRILVTHHPFRLSGRSDDKNLVGRASMALGCLSECMPDVLLAGHMHAHEVGTTADRFDLGGRSAIVVQAGTATSTRARGEKNSFNLLCVDREAVTIRPYDWDLASDTFAPGALRRYMRHDREWVSDGDGG